MIGNPGDFRPIGSGVSELRIDYGSGYRVYYQQKGLNSLWGLCHHPIPSHRHQHWLFCLWQSKSQLDRLAMNILNHCPLLGLALYKASAETQLIL